MRIISSFFLVFLYISVLFLFGCQGLSHGASNYYISNFGDDRSNGKTPESAWKSLAMINNRRLNPGDSIFLQAGGVWREMLNFNASGNQERNIYFGKYGAGENPVILGSDKVLSWSYVQGSQNIWKADGVFRNVSSGNGDGRIFFMKDDSVSWGEYHKNADFSELNMEFDYTVDSRGRHYIYSKLDPNIVYDSVEISQRDRCISFSPGNSYLEFNSIDVRFAASKGIWSGYPAQRGATNLIFRSCAVQYIGKKSGPNDYGISCFHSNVLIEDCFFSDCGRRAISINTYTSPEEGRRIENIIIRNNEFRRGYHTTAIDVSAMKQAGDTILGLYFYNNYIDDSEIPKRDLEAGHRSNQVFIQGGQAGKYLISDFYFVNNLFVKAQTRWINFSGTMSHHIWNNTFAGHNPNQVKSPYGSIASGRVQKLELINNIFVDDLPANKLENNIIHAYNSPDTEFVRDNNLYYTVNPVSNRNISSVDVDGKHKFYSVFQWANYLKDFPDQEQNSPSPSDPQFVDYDNGNYHLTSDSPAKSAGKELRWLIVEDPFGVVDTINKYDYRRHQVRNQKTPSIGAFEF